MADSMAEAYAKHNAEILNQLEKQTKFMRGLNADQTRVLYTMLTAMNMNTTVDGFRSTISHQQGFLRAHSLYAFDIDPMISSSVDDDLEKLLEDPQA